MRGMGSAAGGGMPPASPAARRAEAHAICRASDSMNPLSYDPDVFMAGGALVAGVSQVAGKSIVSKAGGVCRPGWPCRDRGRYRLQTCAALMELTLYCLRAALVMALLVLFRRPSMSAIISLILAAGFAALLRDEAAHGNSRNVWTVPPLIVLVAIVLVDQLRQRRGSRLVTSGKA